MLWKDEVVNTIKKMADSTGRPLYIGMSGGIDGEFIARILLENSIPFSAVTLRYTGNENYHDMVYAVEFCKQHSVKHHIIDVDPDYLYYKKTEEYISQGYCAANIYRYLQLYLLEMVEAMGGTAILGAGEQVYYSDGQTIYLGFSPELLISFDWCKNNNTTHYVNFFLHNPELYASYMKIGIVDAILKNVDFCSNRVGANKQAHPVAAHPEKQIVYHQIYTDMIPRIKFSGFEMFLAERIQLQTNLQKRFPEIEPVYIPVDTIKQQLGIQ
jgi:asparagine synthetase B (glutamine-hydrolysing)